MGQITFKTLAHRNALLYKLIHGQKPRPLTNEDFMKICITNLAAYNDGKLIYTWVSLPSSEEEINLAIEKIQITTDDEIFLSDWESEGIEIGEYSNPFELNEIAEKIEGLSEHDRKRLEYLLKYESIDFEDALDRYEDVMFWADQKLSDVASDMVDEGCFGEITGPLRNYIDYEALGRDLGHDGYIETSEGVFFSGR
jgi:antirestriction protein